MDLIDRASVIKAIDEYERLSMVSQTVRNMTSLREIVQWLPAVQTCEDAVSRQAAIKEVGYYSLHSGDKLLFADKPLKDLPAVQPQRNPDEWCHDCKEYDSEKHCCPRWNRVIRQTLSEQTEIVRCKDCKHADDNGICQNSIGLVIQDDDDFCSRAERKENR